MVLLGRIELPTSALPRMRSTTELQQPTIQNAGNGRERQSGQGRAIALPPCFVKRGAVSADRLMMDEAPAPKCASPADAVLSREERLAAKLRENLRRRKAQARALDRGGGQTGGTEDGEPPSQ